MEMMVVLLIVAIIAAASAPMVSKKISRGTSGEGSWAFTGMGNSIFYSASNNSTAMIGALRVPDGSNPKLYVQSAGNEAQIGFVRSGSNSVISLIMDTVNSRAGFSNASIQNNSVAMGTNQTLSGNSFVAIGDGVQATTNSTTAIGQEYPPLPH